MLKKVNFSLTKYTSAWSCSVNVFKGKEIKILEYKKLNKKKLKLLEQDNTHLPEESLLPFVTIAFLCVSSF